MADEDTTLEIKGLDKLLKAIKARPPIAQIGVMGSKDSRPEDGESNASIGARHEYGDDAMPMRSFLRVPLSDNLNKKLQTEGMFDKEMLKAVIKTGSVIPWLQKVMVVAEGIVQEAFETGGFGKWPPWSSPYYTNGNMRLLDDTGQLRNSITTRIKE